MHHPFHIDLRSLPSDGLDIAGEQPASFFGLEATDSIQPVSPLKYELHVEKDEDELILTGRLEAVFNLECGRCLERFDHRVEIPHYQSEVTIEKDSTIDLTDTIREDTLVTLPNYPRCEDGNVRPRQCPAEGRFEPELETAEEKPQDAGPGVWEALNKLN